MQLPLWFVTALWEGPSLARQSFCNVVVCLVLANYKRGARCVGIKRKRDQACY